MVQMNGAISQVKDFNNFVSSKAVGEFKTGQFRSPEMKYPQGEHAQQTSFAKAIYSDGYSLIHPNQKSDVLAQNIDVLA